MFAWLALACCVYDDRVLFPGLLFCDILGKQGQTVIGNHTPEVWQLQMVLRNVYHLIITQSRGPSLFHFAALRLDVRYKTHITHHDVQVVVTVLFLLIVIISLNSAQTSSSLLAAGLPDLKHILRPRWPTAGGCTTSSCTGLGTILTQKKLCPSLYKSCSSQVRSDIHQSIRPCHRKAYTLYFKDKCLSSSHAGRNNKKL